VCEDKKVEVSQMNSPQERASEAVLADDQVAVLVHLLFGERALAPGAAEALPVVDLALVDRRQHVRRHWLQALVALGPVHVAEARLAEHALLVRVRVRLLHHFKERNFLFQKIVIIYNNLQFISLTFCT